MYRATLHLVSASLLGFPVAIAQDLVLSVADRALHQYEPLHACLEVRNRGADRYTGLLTDDLVVAVQESTNEWAVLFKGRSAHAPLQKLDVKATSSQWIVWSPVLGAPASRPGTYRLGPFEARDQAGRKAVSNSIVFTVEAHAHNAAVIGPRTKIFRELFDSPGGFKHQVEWLGFAKQCAHDWRLSNSIRHLMAARLALYYGQGGGGSESQVLSAGYAALAEMTPLQLPCGGPSALATYYRFRALIMMANIQREWDAAYAKYAAWAKSVPCFEQVYHVDLRPKRRAILPPN